MEQLKRHIISTTLSGDPRVRAGHIIQFNLPEVMGKVGREFPEELDAYLQGKYLIISAAHVTEQNVYYMNLELVKDSFFSNITHRDPVKEYQDVY